VKLFFLPLRVKVSTVPVLPYLLRTLVIVVLRMSNSLDSSALFCTDCDRVTILKFVGLCAWTVQQLFDSWELNINSQKIGEVTKHKQLLFLFFRKLCNFFVLLVGCLIVSFFANFCAFGQTRTLHRVFTVDIVHNEGKNFAHLCKPVSLDCSSIIPCKATQGLFTWRLGTPGRWGNPLIGWVTRLSR